MSRRRHLLLAAAIGVGAAGSWPFAAPAFAQAPSVTAWWDQANVGQPVPPPPPPDVKKGDLFVEGSNAAPATPVSAIGTAPPTAQAVAGLTFTLSPGAIADGLVLKLTGTKPNQISVVACHATTPFKAADDGKWSAVPKYDCKHKSVGMFTDRDTAVTFADIGNLAAGNTLSIVLLPGPLDRAVFAKPGSDALTVEGGTASFAAPPPLTGPPPGFNTAPGAGTTGSAGAPVTAPSGTAPAPVPALAPSAALPSGSSAPGTAPLLAGGASRNARPTALTTIGSADARAVAAATLAVVLLVFALMGGEQGATLRRLRPTPADGPAEPHPLVRPPTLRPTRAGTSWWLGGLTRPPGQDPRGIGRFNKPREGRAPRL